ncbi:MAG TPA: threonine synthase [Gemmatimonadales bacterium]|nr:threonine synthase [Gemmatimonadales bacterium]
MDWTLECSGCEKTTDALGLRTVCPDCGSPYLVRYRRRLPASPPPDLAERPRHMWRYRELLPLADGEEPVSLGEGGTPLLRAPRLGGQLGLTDLWIKDEAANPTGSFKARGIAAAVTRAVAAGATSFVLPTAGNAGVAAAAYGARAGARVRVYAPRTTPAPLLAQMTAYGAEVVTVEGHIGDCGKLARAHAEQTLAFDLSTLREPYRIEGKKTLGIEIAEASRWRLPGAIIYPTGGGTGLIGMWKAFAELIAAGWVNGPMPRLFSVQATGCAPVVRAFQQGATKCEPWPNPETVAAGLQVPGPLGGPLMLKALRQSGGGAVAVTDQQLLAGADLLSSLEGVDACPEGGAAVAAAQALLERGRIAADEYVVLFNTGAGVLYGRRFNPGLTEKS